MKSRLLLCLAVPLITACAPTTAIVDGKQVARLDLDFVGRPFAIRHVGAHPQPGGASSGVRDYGGRVIGNVCGLDLSYEVQHQGDTLVLTGFIDDGHFDSSLRVHDELGTRRLITGSLAPHSGAVEVDLRVSRIKATIGQRVFEMARDGDRYIGVLRVGTRLTANAIIEGADELWAMPPATQAAVLPSLLTCFGSEIEDLGRGKFVVGFGGRQTFEPRHVSALYHDVYSDMQSRQLQSGMGVQ